MLGLGLHVERVLGPDDERNEDIAASNDKQNKSKHKPLVELNRVTCLGLGFM